jgi:hypothetical protein
MSNNFKHEGLIKLKALLEASLTGVSRSGGMSVWDYYVAKDFDADKIYIVEKDGFILDANTAIIGNVVAGEQIQILSPELTVFKNSKYASIRQLSTNLVGLLSLSSIKKPRIKSAQDGLFGSPQSKEFLPEKLNLIGKTYTSGDQLIKETTDGLYSAYSDTKYSEIVNYLIECMNVAKSSSSINEIFTRKHNLSKSYKIAKQDVGILSKNFGEIIAAIYVVSNNKKASGVKFPDNISNPLYDFIMIKQNNFAEYYSVKSHGGSSTSIENLNFLLKNFQENNSFFAKYRHEIDVIMSLMNNKKEGITTLNNIENFFEKTLPDKQKRIIQELNKITSYKLKSLSQIDLNAWFDDMLKSNTVENFISTMTGIYTDILGDMPGGPSGATVGSLRDMFVSKQSKDNGFIYYPMGSYIVKYLNNSGNYLFVLNELLNYASYIHQFSVDMYTDRLDITIESFKTKKFKFSYNAGAKYPANRPIGFISA